MKNKVLVALLIVFGFAAQAQQETQPKLVVGIVVDQMRADYLYRFWNKYQEGGFKRLVNEGYNCRNMHFDYVPTYTGPGHASVFSGAGPAQHGIISNNWYDRALGSNTYCVLDRTVATVGAANDAGLMSPRNMKSTTFTDELRLATNFKGKVIGVSLKDRASILPAGHTPNAAYWFDGASGCWITSTFYMDKLPNWVTAINNEKPAMKYLVGKWETLLPISQYTESGPDSTRYESPFKGNTAPVFPHDLAAAMQAGSNQDLIKSTPFGNTITADFARAAIINEKLGKDAITDVLTLSFSATDYVGHKFAVRSIEIEDTYIRLDRDLAALFALLDKEVGKGEYTVFLTADHGAADNPNFLLDNRINAGFVEGARFDSVSARVGRAFGSDKLITSFSNHQYYLNYEELEAKNISKDVVIDFIIKQVSYQHGVYATIKSSDLLATSYDYSPLKNFSLGYYPKRSGDLLIITEPGFYEDAYGRTGTTHGSHYAYDTHVPFLMMGKGIKHGDLVEKVYISQIAPTMSMLLNIPFPSGSYSHPIHQILEK